MPNHPKKYLSEMLPQNVVYRKYTQKGIDGIKKRRNISIGHESFYLCKNYPYTFYRPSEHSNKNG